MKSVHNMQFWVFCFPKQKICAQRCGRINLERMDVVDIILLTRCFREAYTGLPVVRATENQKALNCVVLKYVQHSSL